MRNKLIKITLPILFIVYSFGCNDAWDEHKKISSDTPSKTILEMLSLNSEYSKFTNSLVETGLDKTLDNTLLYSVWVPTNNSINELPDDSIELYNWVANHIVLGTVRYDEIEELRSRIKMLNGKNLDLNIENSTIDEIVFNNEYIVARNGILYETDAPLEPRINIWEYIEEVAQANKHINYLNSLTGEVFNPDSAEIIGYTDSGKPIYDTISGMVWDNLFITDVADLRSEDSTFTMLIVDDQVFDSEYETFYQYFRVTSGPTEADSMRNKEKCEYKITKDYVFDSTYYFDDLPAYLMSLYGVKVPIDKGSIYDSYKCSNGWVYKIRECSIDKRDKILPLRVEGENEFRIFEYFTENGEEMDGSQYGYKRINNDASGGFDYVVDNWTTDAKGGGLILHVGEVASMKYKFYLQAVHDFNGSFRRSKGADYVLMQQLGWTSLIKETLKGYDFNPATLVSDTIFVRDSSYQTAKEFEVGSYKFTSVKDAYVWLQPLDDGAAVVADYIKLVPDFDE